MVIDPCIRRRFRTHVDIASAPPVSRVPGTASTGITAAGRGRTVIPLSFPVPGYTEACGYAGTRQTYQTSGMHHVEFIYPLSPVIDRIGIEYHISADGHLFKHIGIGAYIEIGKLHGIRKEVIASRQVQLVYQLYLLDAGTGRILSVLYLCFQVVAY